MNEQGRIAMRPYTGLRTGCRRMVLIVSGAQRLGSLR